MTKRDESKYMFVGDSRMVGVGTSVQGLKAGRYTRPSSGNDVVGQGKDGNFYYASGGQSYSWFKANVGNIAEKAKSESCDYVVINMGVNDWPNFTTEAGAKRMADNYLALAKQIEQQSGKKVVFVTPYPLHGEYAANRYNQQYDRSRKAINQGLQRFNRYIEQGANKNGFGFINIYDEVYEYINNSSYWNDGVHGSSKLNALIDQLWKNALAKMQTSERSQSYQAQTEQVIAATGTQLADGIPMAVNYSARVVTTDQTSYQRSVHSSETREEQQLSKKQDSSKTQLTAKQRQYMASWARRVKLSECVVNQLVEKYGANAYDLMLKAMMSPHYLAGYLGQTGRSSKKTVEMLVNLDEGQVQLLYKKYGLRGEVNSGVTHSTSTDREEAISSKVHPSNLSNGETQESENSFSPVQLAMAAVSNVSADFLVGSNYMSVIEKMPEYLVQFENMKLKSYWDVNSPSIGLGTKQYWTSNTADPTGRQIRTRSGQTCTRAEAVLWAKQNLVYIYKQIKKAGLNVEKMTENQLIGVLSFAYNYGPGYLTSSKYGGPARIRAINAYLDDPTNVSKRDEVRKQMRATGSNKRRAFEAAMVLGDVDCDHFSSIKQECLKSISYTYRNGHYIGVDANIEQYNSTNTRKGTAYAQVWGRENDGVLLAYNGKRNGRTV